jgi:glycosyltransferase involved in cell wall biosynthesis
MSTATLDDTHVLAPRRLEIPSSTIRVCHVSVGLCTGGLERLLVDFARFHDRTRFEMQFVALRNLGRPAEEIRDLGCDVHGIGAEQFGLVGRLRELTRLLRQVRPDVVHTHNANPHLYGTLAARLAGVPVVVNTRHGQRFGQTAWDRRQFRWVSRLADRVIAVSEDAARLTVSDDGLPATKVARVWNGIDTERFAYRGPTPKPWAISVARLSPEKDFPTLLRSVPETVIRVPDYRLRIVGDGPERPRLESLVRELHIENYVELLGERSDVPELLAQAGFFVTSSLTEGISLTLLEAMAVGLPIVATNVGGNPEIVQDGFTGRLVPAGDPAALAFAISQFCLHRNRWPDMSRAGRRRVLDHFDVRRMLRNYEASYTELLRSKRRPTSLPSIDFDQT